MKISEMQKDSKALAEKNLKDYYKRMKKNRYWRKGYDAGKHNQGAQDNPYKLTPDMITILKKRTFWAMGQEEGYYKSSQRKKQLKAMAEKPKREPSKDEKSRRDSRENTHKHRRKNRDSHR
jgi:hypothetical protein